MTDSLKFPLFRKYPDNRTYFRIISHEEFEEIKVMGGFYQVHQYKAEKLPDRNLLDDMIHQEDGFWETSTEEEFLNFKAYCEAHYQKLQ